MLERKREEAAAAKRSELPGVAELHSEDEEDKPENEE